MRNVDWSNFVENTIFDKNFSLYLSSSTTNFIKEDYVFAKVFTLYSKAFSSLVLPPTFKSVLLCT